MLLVDPRQKRDEKRIYVGHLLQDTRKNTIKKHVWFPQLV